MGHILILDFVESFCFLALTEEFFLVNREYINDKFFLFAIKEDFSGPIGELESFLVGPRLILI